jgi:RNA polymerase sigma-70 factor (ECF subfamily)
MKPTQATEFVLTDYARKLIKCKARQLSRRRDFQPVDWEDLQQELWLALVKAARHFDPAKAALDTFIDRVVNTAAAMLVRARQRLRKGANERVQSLSDELVAPDGRSEPLAATICRDDLARRIGTQPADETHFAETTEAVATALHRMPTDLRDVCQRLMGGTVTSVARDLSLSRRQVRNCIRKARPHFEHAGEEF